MGCKLYLATSALDDSLYLSAKQHKWLNGLKPFRDDNHFVAFVVVVVVVVMVVVVLWLWWLWLLWLL